MIKAGFAGFEIGDDRPLGLIGGPCVIESEDICLEVGAEAKRICDKLGIQYIFKASFDKANRTSVESFRGPGLDKGLEILAGVKSKLGCGVVTDIHEAYQAAPVAEVADILQIPAFLCRQTDLIVAAAKTGKCVNIKKGQFLSPADMKNSVGKARSTGNDNIILTERGSSFGYNMLVVDMCSLPTMRALGCPVIFDATHSVQRPGGLGNASGGAREFIPTLLRSSIAAGADGLFMEIHPEPEKGLCDAACMFRLSELEAVLTDAVNIRKALGKK
ncbi:MAG: 3-deoxy-8-phosphooctulonate synthase [Abditibacteriota bacterium]|nr:3-deoxy-8-phosphooctulonate synthase [Abditibacteriota bacterium]MBP5739171.1 3-deoxy-8-phosphooctulonate synthase [Abditibacteriota bacterium]